MLSTKVNIVVAPGSSILLKLEELKSASSETTNLIAYSSSVLFFPDKVGRWPDYWFWIDPVSAMDGLHRIVNDNVRIPTKILLPSCVSNKADFLDNNLSTRCNWDEYLSLIHKIRSAGLADIIDFDCITQYKLAREGVSLAQYNDVKSTIRFSLPYCLLGAKKRPDDSAQAYNDMEKKLTMAVLPIMAHFKAVSVGVVGFDGRGGRWHEPNNLRGVDGAFYDYLTMWSEEGWGGYLHWFVFSLLEDRKYVLNRYIPYCSIESAVRRLNGNLR